MKSDMKIRINPLAKICPIPTMPNLLMSSHRQANPKPVEFDILNTWAITAPKSLDTLELYKLTTTSAQFIAKNLDFNSGMLEINNIFYIPVFYHCSRRMIVADAKHGNQELRHYKYWLSLRVVKDSGLSVVLIQPDNKDQAASRNKI